MDELFDFSSDFVSDEQTTDRESNALWVNKYRPDSLADMCLDANLKKLFESQIKNGDVKNMTLIGPPGTGKTTLALALCKEIDADVLFIPCASGEGRIDTIQMRIVPFCQYASPKRKVVILDELDSASSIQVNSFQKALRNVIESFPDCRFLATANYEERILPPILSRLPATSISFSTQQMLQRILFIFKSEKVDATGIDPAVFRDLLLKIIRRNFPDVRSLLGKLQMACTDGLSEEKLKALCVASQGSEKFDELFTEILRVVSDRSIRPLNMRQYVSDILIKIAASGNDGVGLLSNSYEFAKNLFEFILKRDCLKPETELDTLADMTAQLRTIEICADKDTQVFRFLLLLRKGLAA